MRFFSSEQLRELSGTVFQSWRNYRASRTSLWLGVAAEFLGQVHERDAPLDQIDQDLDSLNQQDRLSTGELPFEIYLRNCAYRARQESKGQATVFQKFADILAAHQSAMERPLVYVIASNEDEASTVLTEIVSEHEQLLQAGDSLQCRPPFAPAVIVILSRPEPGTPEARLVPQPAENLLIYEMPRPGAGETEDHAMEWVAQISTGIRKDVPDLLARSRDTLLQTQPPRFSNRSATPPPSYLPYACDRFKHYAPIGDLKKSIAVYLIDGPEEEDHQAFHQRLSLQYMQGQTGLPPVRRGDPIAVNWPPPRDPNHLVRHLAVQLFGVLDTIPSAFLGRLPAGLTHCVFYIPSWNDADLSMVPALIRQLQNWPAPEAGKALWIGISVLEGPASRKSELPVPEPGEGFQLLPTLDPVPRLDAENWTGQPPVNTLYSLEQRARLRAAIPGIYVDASSLPMKVLAARLYSLLEKHCT
jgi:hypothetical protein